MAAKEVRFHDDARARMATGVNILAKARPRSAPRAATW